MSSDGVGKMIELHKIYAMIPEDEYQVLQDSGILTSHFDLWIAILIKKQLEEEGFLNEDGTRTEKLRFRHR
jgi:hypothetical protein